MNALVALPGPIGQFGDDAHTDGLGAGEDASPDCVGAPDHPADDHPFGLVVEDGMLLGNEGKPEVSAAYVFDLRKVRDEDVRDRDRFRERRVIVHHVYPLCFRQFRGGVATFATHELSRPNHACGKPLALRRGKTINSFADANGKRAA